MVTFAIFFDLFETLVTIDRGFLTSYFDREIDRLGDLGQFPDAHAIIEHLAVKNPQLLQHGCISDIAQYYETTLRQSLMHPPRDVLQMLQKLKQKGYQLCIISDAAYVDIAHWHESPLKQYFTDAVFSCDIGIVKPDAGLYQMAHFKMSKPTKMLYIGDGGHDELMGAHQFGMVTAKAEWIRNRTDPDVCAHADYRLLHPSQVLALTNKITSEEAE